MALIDEAYQNRTEWIKKSIYTSARMGKFSSDRAIQDYAQEYWVSDAPLFLSLYRRPSNEFCVHAEHRERQGGVRNTRLVKCCRSATVYTM